MSKQETTEQISTKKRLYWSNHIKQWQTSGKTQSDYCQQHQLKLHQLHYWRRVFKDAPASQAGGNDHPVSNGFSPVQLVQPSDSNNPFDLTIELPNGLCIKGIHADNFDLVQAIIRSQS